MARVPIAVRVEMTITATTQEGVDVALVDESWFGSDPKARAPAQFFPVQLDPEKVM